MSDRYFISDTDLRGLAADLLGAGTDVIAPVATDICQSPSAIAASACTLDGSMVDIDYRALGPRRRDGPQSWPAAALPQGLLPARARGALPLEAARRHRRGGGGPDRVRPARRACREALRQRRPRRRRPGHELGLQGRALERPARGDDDHQSRLPVIDDSCFCTAVATAPDDVKGADGLLTPVDGGYVFEPSTDKGRALTEAHKARFSDDVEADTLGRQADDERAAARARVAANLEIDAGSVRDWIDTHFEDPLLSQLAIRCNGCGACTSVCPTCHCFDIVDEEEGVGRGTRRRCWDTCQAPTFTLHASGHNPRDDQNHRYRQRINHKFAIYPLKFGEVLCTGCGRCTRVCHAGQDLVEILQAIDIAARRPGDATDEPAEVAS